MVMFYLLAAQAGEKHKDLFISCLKDSSYSVAGEAFSALINMDEVTALKWLPDLRKDARGSLEIAVKKAEILSKTDAHFNELYEEIVAVQKISRLIEDNEHNIGQDPER